MNSDRISQRQIPVDEKKLDHIKQMVRLARYHFENGGANASEVYYRMIIKECTPPQNGIERVALGEAWVFFARKNLYNHQNGAALDCYLKAIRADPYAVDYRVEYCIKVLIPMGMFKYARMEAERATRIEPNNSEAWRLLGGIEAQMMHVPASIKAYDKQLELDPGSPTARLDRATVALDTADYDTVRVMCEPVLKTERAADAYHTLAMALYREGKHEEAIEYYDKAIEGGCFDPDLATWNKSLALHAIGRYKEGWVAHEHRGQQTTDQGMALVLKRFEAPRWSLEPPPARLHVHQEMGHGDVIAMARYLPLLQEQGYDVTFEVNDSMVALMQYSLPGVKVAPRAIDYPGAMGIQAFDYHVPTLSLPYLMETTVETIPWRGAYLKANPGMAASYEAKFEDHIKTRIGLVWSSGIRDEGLWLSQYGRKKSMPFKTLASAFWNVHDKYDFVSLQIGPERAEHQGELIDVLPEQPTWEQTAALVDRLDLVITVDTSVAHLAGAMGKPTIVMMQKDGASWHFMCERKGAIWNDKSPWYPSTRIFRQKSPGDWSSVIDQIKMELEGSG
jgi:tetratricopeptide (TPR) repeat protein